MAISDQLTQLNTIKQNIKTAINNKGGSVGNNFSTYAAAIAALPTAPAASEITYGKADVVTIKSYDSTVKTIGDRDFQSWLHATGLVIGEGFEDIQEYAFANWSNAVSLKFPASLKTIANNVFQNWSALTALTLTSNITSIGNQAFNGCTKIANKLIIGSSITSVGTGCFSGCTAIPELEIKNGLTTITAAAFYNLTACLKVSLPASITSIASQGLHNLTSCTELICLATTPPTLAAVSSLAGLNASCVIKVPAASLAAYQAATNWSAHASKMVGI